MSYCRPKWLKLTPNSDQNRAAHTAHIKDYPAPPGPSIIVSMFLMKITDLPISRIKESEVECSAMASGSCNLPQYCNCQRCKIKLPRVKTNNLPNVSLHRYQYLARLLCWTINWGGVGMSHGKSPHKYNNYIQSKWKTDLKVFSLVLNNNGNNKTN